MHGRTGPKARTHKTLSWRPPMVLAVAALTACAPQATRQPEVTEETAEPAQETVAATAQDIPATDATATGGDQATETDAEAEPMVVSGTIRYLDLEGGLYVIESEGTSYNPIDLPQDFQVDGMRVEAELQQRDDMAGVGMVGPMVELLDIRQAEDTEGEATAMVADATLWGSAWRLEDLGGRSAMSGVEVTLQFPDEGRAVGNASCNRFFGQVVAEGDSISFSDIGTMRMACPPNINDQEHRFLEALGDAERYEIEEPYLRIFGGEEEQPLRFVRVEG